MPPKLRLLIGHPLLWGVLGTSALSLLIWLLGPRLVIQQLQPLEPALHRQIAIGLCVFGWILFQLIPRLYSAWFNSKLLVRLQQDNSANSNHLETQALLNQRFSDALQLLKRTQFQPSHAKGNWFSRFNTQYLYELPWYMIIGAPGAGKTTALVNSGLEFPLGDTLGKSAVRGIGGTRHCDWWFTQDAVLLDTAGRYTLQESMRARDASEWQAFIGLLKRYRARQPINGVIVTLSVADLLSDTSEMRHAQAVALRQRLQELHQQTDIDFPVYVMVTKTDLLKGFMSYFAHLDKAGRQQDWGFTFPWENTPQSREDLSTRFEQRFHHLHQQLMVNLSTSMTQQRDLRARADAFLFPQEFASLRPLLAEYLDVIFSPDNERMPWSPRGLFFSSGTQEGLPFDRVMGELTRKLQLPVPRSQTLASWDSVSRQAPVPATKGQSFFIHDLLRQRIFREKGLAGSDRRWEYRHRLFHWLGYGALACTLLIVGTLWTVSYFNNRTYLQEVAQRLPAIEQQLQPLEGPANGNVMAVVPFLNSLIALPQNTHASMTSPPATQAMGLWRGGQVTDASWALYQYALRTVLLPRVAQSITLTLRNDKGDDNDFSRNALRAYQMLYQPRTYDGEFLRGWVMQNIQRNLPSGVTPRDLQQLDWHLSQLLDKQIQSSPYLRDNTLMMRKLAARLEEAGLPLPDQASVAPPPAHSAVFTPP